MSAGRPEKRVPVKYGADHGERITTRDVAEAVADCCDADDGPGASDAIDRLFIFGAWGNVLAREDGDLYAEAASGLTSCRRSIRSLVRCAYKVGRERGAAQHATGDDGEGKWTRAARILPATIRLGELASKIGKVKR